MLSNGQKNFILGLIGVIIVVLLGLYAYKTLNTNENQSQVVDKTTGDKIPEGDDKKVLDLNKDQYIAKWCEFNSQDPFTCLEGIQACRKDIKSNECDSDSFKLFEESWDNNKNPNPHPDTPTAATVDQKVLLAYCKDFSSEEKQCVVDMNACFDKTSSDKACKDYIRNFNNETDGGKSYGDISFTSNETTQTNASLESIFAGSSNIPQVKACKGNSNCNIFHALAENWKLIPDDSRYKALAKEGDGYGLWKGYSYTDDRVYELANAGEEVFYRGGAATPKEEKLFGQGLAVLLYLQGPI